MTSQVPVRDWVYRFLRAALRVDDLLRSSGIKSPDSPDSPDQNQWSQAGMELTLLASIVGGGLILLLFLRLSAGTSLYRWILNRLFLPSALFAAPIAYLVAANITSEWPLITGREALPYPLLRISLPATVLAAEILCTGILFFIHRAHPISLWTMCLLLVSHYALWVRVLWGLMGAWADRPFYALPGLYALCAFFTPRLFVIVFPLAGVFWLVHFKPSGLKSAESQTVRRAGKWTFAGAAVSLALLAFIWFPGRSHSLVHPKDLKSVLIELERERCYGDCPAYKVDIHGNGRVEYFGKSYVRVHGQQASTIDDEKLMHILQQLDGADFFTIDDRIFPGCLDVPHVSVALPLDGMSKKVESDAQCVNSRPQEDLLRAAQEIDTIVGSDRWVRCEDRCPK